jgi:hypothetical protein
MLEVGFSVFGPRLLLAFGACYAAGLAASTLNTKPATFAPDWIAEHNRIGDISVCFWQCASCVVASSYPPSLADPD